MRWLDSMQGALSALTAVDPDIAIIGIRSGGVTVADLLHARLNINQPLGELNIAFYRDDFSTIGLHPVVGPSQVPFVVEGRHIVLIDDVLSTGRTVRAAMNEIFDYGRPSKISLAVLVERDGRELPICADVAGYRVKLPPASYVSLNDKALTVSIGDRS